MRAPFSSAYGRILIVLRPCEKPARPAFGPSSSPQPLVPSLRGFPPCPSLSRSPVPSLRGFPPCSSLSRSLVPSLRGFPSCSSLSRSPVLSLRGFPSCSSLSRSPVPSLRGFPPCSSAGVPFRPLSARSAPLCASSPAPEAGSAAQDLHKYFEVTKKLVIFGNSI